MKGVVRDGSTGKPLSSATITVRNVTRINATHARADVINHDITSGELVRVPLLIENGTLVVVPSPSASLKELDH